MAEKKSIKMHADTLRNIVIFLVVLAAALFFLVYPRHNSIKVLDSRGRETGNAGGRASDPEAYLHQA